MSRLNSTVSGSASAACDAGSGAVHASAMLRTSQAQRPGYHGRVYASMSESLGSILLTDGGRAGDAGRSLVVDCNEAASSCKALSLASIVAWGNLLPHLLGSRP